MARITKAQLEQQVASQAEEILGLRQRLEQLSEEMAQAVDALAIADAELAAQRMPSRRVQRAGYVAPAWQAERAAAMAAARAAAMRMGRTVMVAA